MLKQKILQQLIEHPDCPLSGQTLAAELQVSRNAVWKAVNVLKQEGYPIYADGRKGYVLRSTSNHLSAETILSYLPPSMQHIRIIAEEEMDSTNREARRLLADGFHGHALLVCNHQTAGKGHQQTSFSSPRDTGLYMSVILPVDIPIELYRNIPMAAAYALIDTLKELSHLPFRIRGIDEIYLHDNKIGGILCEAYSAELESGMLHAPVIGIGLHLTQSELSENLLDSMFSLGYAVSRNRLAALLTEKLSGIDLCDTDAVRRSYQPLVDQTISNI
ncbi:MAG: HTH domain-containing protein [Eubacteriales bacterium]|nr:HTH domain-containing protein [Eubacteriales bacterium]